MFSINPFDNDLLYSKNNFVIDYNSSYYINSDMYKVYLLLLEYQFVLCYLSKCYYYNFWIKGTL